MPLDSSKKKNWTWSFLLDKHAFSCFESIAKDYDDLMKNEESSDVTLFENEKFAAHKLILYTRISTWNLQVVPRICLQIR